MFRCVNKFSKRRKSDSPFTTKEKNIDYDLYYHGVSSTDEKDSERNVK